MKAIRVKVVDFGSSPNGKLPLNSGSSVVVKRIYDSLHNPTSASSPTFCFLSSEFFTRMRDEIIFKFGFPLPENLVATHLNFWHGGTFQTNHSRAIVFFTRKSEAESCLLMRGRSRTNFLAHVLTQRVRKFTEVKGHISSQKLCLLMTPIRSCPTIHGLLSRQTQRQSKFENLSITGTFVNTFCTAAVKKKKSRLSSFFSPVLSYCTSREASRIRWIQ